MIKLYSKFLPCILIGIASLFSFHEAKAQAVVNYTVSNACGISDNGSILFTVTGVAPLSIRLIGVNEGTIINQAATSGVPVNIPNLPDDSYIIIVFDGDLANPNYSGGTNVTSVTPITGITTSVVDNSDQTCLTPNGSISITAVTGGSGAYNFQWSGPGGYSNTSQNISSLQGGAYTVIITDQTANCTFTSAPITVTDPLPSTFTISTPDNTLCLGDALQVDINPSIPTNGIQYTLYDGATAVGTTVTWPTSSISFSGLSAGLHNNIRVEGKLAGSICTPIFSTNTLSVNVSAPPTSATLVLSGTTPICAGSTSTIRVNIVGGAAPYSFTIDNGVGLVSGYNSGSNITVSPAVTTIYSFVGGITDNNGCTVAGTGTAQVDVNPIPTITLDPIQSICSGTTSATLPYTATTGTPTQYRIDWDNTANIAGVADVALTALPASPIPINGLPASVTVATTFNGTLYVRNAGTCESLANPISVTIFPIPTISTNAISPVCFGTDGSLVYTATTGTPSQYRIDWDAVANLGGLADVAFTALPASPIVISGLPNVLSSTTFNGTLFVRNAGNCVSTGNAISITVNPVPSITLNPIPAICSGTTSSTLPYTATTGNPTQYRIDWNAAANLAGVADVSLTALPASPVPITGLPASVAVVTTFNGTLFVRNAAGCEDSGTPISVTISPIPSITLNAIDPVCFGTDGSLVYTGTTGTPTQYRIDWNAAANTAGLADVTLTALPASPIVISGLPNVATSTTFNGTLYVSNAGNCESITGNAISITVNPIPTITLGTIPGVCSGVATSSLSYSATSGSPTQYRIDWDPTANLAGFADVALTGLPVSPISISGIPAVVSTTTFNGTLFVRSAAGCEDPGSAISVTVTANVTPSVSIVSDLGATICAGANVTFTATPTNGGVTPTYQWKKNGTDIVGAVNATYADNGLVNTDQISVVLTSSISCVTAPTATSNVINMTVNPVPTISLGTIPGVCSGITTSSLSYSATTGTPTQYRIDWNGAANLGGLADVALTALPATPISITGLPTVVSTTTFNGTLFVRNASGCEDLGSSISITITGNVTPSVSIVSDLGASICAGANVTFTATPTNGGVTPTYQWKKNGTDIVGAVNATYSDNGLVDTDQISVVLTSSITCVTTSTATSNVINMTVTPNVTPSVSIVSDLGASICAGANVTFTATPTNGGATPTYQWKKNGTDIVGAVNATYADNGLVDTDQISVVLTSSLTCVTTPTATSNVINMTVTTNVTPSVSIVSDLGATICTGANVTFTATPTNGGVTPTYQWKKNGTDIVGAVNATYSDNGLVNTDQISVVLTSSITCVTAATATSNVISITVTTPVTPSVSIVSDLGATICAGANVTFTATPTNGGVTPTYQWKKNGTDIVGAVNATYADNGLVNTDQISVVLTSSISCVTTPTATSNVINMTVTAPLTPAVGIASNLGVTICAGTNVTFTASPANGGVTPTYQWKMNGADIVGAVNATYSDNGLANGNQISVVLTSSISCVTSATANSNVITMTVNPTPVAPAITFSPSVYCVGATITAPVVTSPVFGSTYTWFSDALLTTVLTTGATPTNTQLGFSSTSQNNTTVYVAETNASNCTGAATSVSLIVSSPATAAISGTTTICVGSSTALTFTLTGAQPWNIVYSDGTTNIAVNGITSSSHVINVNPLISTTYSLVSVSDAGCGAGAASGSATVTVNSISGNPATAGVDTWLGYVYNDAATPGVYDFNISKYRGVLNETDLLALRPGVVTYDATTDKFDMALSNAFPVQGSSICGSFLDFYSMRFRMRKTFAAGVYTFTVGSDDGVRLIVDGIVRIDQFNLHGFTQYTSAGICLSAGQHDIVIEYFEQAGSSRLKFDYQTIGTPTTVTAPVSICVNSAAPTLTATSSGATGYKWFTDSGLTNQVASTQNYTPSATELDITTAGTTTFYVVGVYACGDTPAASVDVDVINSATLVASANPFQVCQAATTLDLTTIISATPTGGTIVFAGTGVTGNDFDISQAVGTYSLTADYSTGTCNAPTLNFDIEIINNAVVTVPVAATDVCELSIVDLSGLVSATPTGGTFSFFDVTSGTPVAITGNQFDPAGLSGTIIIRADYAAATCTDSKTFNLNVIGAPTISTSNTTICPNGGNLDLRTLVTVNPSGGTFTFTGSPAITGNFLNPTSIAGTTVSISVTYDIGGGCSISTSTPISITVRASNDPACGGGGGCSFPTIAKTDATCNGINDGIIRINTISGGTAPYQYSIDNGVTWQTIASLPVSSPGLAGGRSYAVLVKDNVGCTSSVNTIFIDYTTTIAASSITKTDVTTCTGTDGTIVFTTVTGGTGPYTYSSNGSAGPFTAGVVTGSGEALQNLAAGNYVAVIKDANGCLSASTNVSIGVPATCNGTGTCASVIITPVPTPAQCTLSNGAINFTINPAVPLVNNTGVKITITGVSTTNATIARTNFNDPSFAALPIGVYNYSIEYGDPGCVKTGQVTIDQSGTVGTPSASNIVGPKCSGQSSGSLTLDVPGEAGNVLEWSLDGVLWNQFTAGNQITGIPAGAAPSFTRVISVRKSSTDPCNAAVTVTIQDQFTPIVASVTVQQGATCNNNDGSVLATYSGGDSGGAGYTFELDGSPFAMPTDKIIKGLRGGSHTLKVIDNQTCSVTLSGNQFFVPSPGLIQFDLTKIDPTCTGNGEDGKIVGAILQSFLPGNYEVAITQQQGSNSTFKTVPPNGSIEFTGLSKGKYFVTVRSSVNGCPNEQTIEITDGPARISFDQEMTCELGAPVLKLTSINVTPGAFKIQITKLGALTSSEITLAQNPAGGIYSVKGNELPAEVGDYEIKIVQVQGACTISSATSRYTNNGVLSVEAKNIAPSYVDVATGAFTLNNFKGGVKPYYASIRFDSAANPVNEIGFATPMEEVTELDPATLGFVKKYNRLHAGRYHVTVEEEGGCSVEFDVRVPLDVTFNVSAVPNIFTPNGDGINDFFFIRNLPAESALVISNRWGKEVYSTKSYQNDWTGGDIADGMYYYRLKAGEEVITGWIEIMRGK